MKQTDINLSELLNDLRSSEYVGNDHRYFIDNILFLQSDFLKEIKEKGQVLSKSETPDDLLKANLIKFTRNLKSEYINSFLNQEGLFETYKSLWSSCVQVIKWQDVLLFEIVVGANTQYFLVVLKPNSTKLGDFTFPVGIFLFTYNNELFSYLSEFTKGKSPRNRIGGFYYDIGRYSGISKIFKKPNDLNHTDINILDLCFGDKFLIHPLVHEANKYFNSLIVKKIPKEYFKRSDKNFLVYASNQRNNSMSNYVYFLFQKHLIQTEFTKQERSILKAINDTHKLHSNQFLNFLERISLVLVLRNAPFATERYHQYRYVFLARKIYFQNNYQSLELLSKGKDVVLFDKLTKQRYHTKNDNFYPRYMHVIHSFSLRIFKMLSRLQKLETNSGRMLHKYFSQFREKGLKEEQLPKNDYEHLIYALLLFVGCKLPSNLTTFTHKTISKYFQRKPTLSEFQEWIYQSAILIKDYFDFTIRKAGGFLDYENVERNINDEEDYSWDDVYHYSYRTKWASSYSLFDLYDEQALFHDRFTQIEDDIRNILYPKPKEKNVKLPPLMLDETEILGVKIKQLRQEAEFIHESEVMDHCISGYASLATLGSRFFYHIGDYTGVQNGNTYSESTLDIMVEPILRNGVIYPEFEISQHQTLSNGRKFKISTEHRVVAEEILNRLRRKYGMTYFQEGNDLSQEMLFKDVKPFYENHRRELTQDEYNLVFSRVSGLTLYKKVLES